MKAKKSLAAAWALILAISMLAGCGSNSGNINNSAPIEGTSASSADGSQTAVVDDSLPSWKRDTSPVTIDWFVSYDWYSKIFNPQTNVADKKVMDETGITINMISGDVEKFNSLIAANSLPDIVTMDVAAPQRKLLENNGQVLPLDVLMEEHAPDMNVPPSMIDWYRNADGHWYTFASYFTSPERTTPEYGGFMTTHNNNYVRTDILGQIGMTMDDMKTKDGFMSALKKVKEMGITYNRQAVTPFLGVSEVLLAEQFGMDWEDREGNLLSQYKQPEFLEAMLYYNEMYINGLITDEEFTLDMTQRDTKIASGSVFAATHLVMVENSRKALYSADPNALLLHCGQITGDGGKTPWLMSVNTTGWSGTLISKNAKNPSRAIQLLSFLSTEEMNLDAEYGTGTYTVENGKVLKNPDIQAEYEKNWTAAFAKYNLDIQFMEDYCVIQRYMSVPIDIFDADLYHADRDPNIHIYDNKYFTDIDPELGTELATVKASIDEYWTQAKPRIIMASSQDKCRAAFEGAIAEIYRMGQQEIDDYRDARFQERKEFLGIKYVWPRNLEE